MARIRTIKPDFFTSEDIVSLSPLARLLYIATWLEADRDGRFVWRPKTLKFRYLPGDNCDIEALSGELVDSGLVVPYEIDGQTYAEIPTFAKHQVINNRETASSISPRVDDASGTRDSRDKHASGTRDDATTTPLVGREGKGSEGKGDIGPSPVVEGLFPDSSKKKSATTLRTFIDSCRTSSEKPIPEDDPVFTYAESVGIAREMITVAWGEFKHYWLDGEGKANRRADWRETFRNAIRQNRAGLWFLREGEQAKWTTRGEQARRDAA